GQSHKNLVFYAECPQYYGTFKPILDALDSLKHPYTYYTSSQNDPALKRLDSNNRLDSSKGLESSLSKNGEFIYIGEGNKAYNLLNRLRADILVLTTPGLDVLHIKRNRGVAHYCHIVHSLSPMTYRVFGVDYFDSVLVANEVQEDFIRDIESAHNVKRKHIAITGSTYLDELSLQANALESFPKNSTKTILVSPSWGKETLLNKYGLDLLLPLAKSSYHIIIRPHPQSYISPSEKANIQHLQEALKDYSNVEWDKDTPNIYAFARADMMISDFSSVIFDFVCLQGKPVLTIDNDMDLSGYDMADIE
ncbi:CDP-glycerol glycerophosphotransferase family protein, partial [Helicobacter bilis]|uniref:CDP-glycerol glycerophosphotransferase family protein n=1 Tax=Helicobacter bilis TaxID=37372 RepID=UPI001F013B98